MRNLLRVCVATLAAISLMSTFTGCTSGSGEDVVYLHVVHGYAGGGAVTIFGPDGTIADGIKFGEAAGPVAFDRSTYQGEMSLQLDGVPGIVSKTFDLYSLYPGEHATLLLQRRSSYTNVEVDLLRHHQLTIDQAAPSAFQCAFEIKNAMSLTNDFSDDRFSFATEWRFSQAQYSAYYNDSIENSVDTECGPLNLNDIGQIGTSIIATRRQLYDELITPQPWFFPVPSDDEAEGSAITFRKGVFNSPGQISGFRSTKEYRECLSQAIQIEQDPTAMMMGDSQCGSNPDGSPAVPTDAMGRPLVTVDGVSVANCLRPINYAPFVLGPDTDESTIFYYNPDNAAGSSCNQSMRLRTHSVDAVFDPPLQQPTRSNGKLVQIDLAMPKGTWQHVVVYGRPIAPLVYMFTSDDLEGGLTEDWTAPEYPNNTIPPDPGSPRMQVVSGM